MAQAAWARLRYLRVGADADFMDRMKTATTTALIGWPADDVRMTVARSVTEVVKPLVYPEARALLTAHRERSDDLVLVSSSGVEVVEPIAALLGIPDVIATRMQVRDGRYTGGIDYFAYAEQKAVAVRRLAGERGYDLTACHAYSDSITDAPLLRCVGHHTAVNPDRELLRLATAEGWPVRRFRRTRR